MTYKTCILDLIGRMGQLDRVIYCIQRWRYMRDTEAVRGNTEILRDGLPDKLPCPEMKMVYLVTGQFKLQTYYENGELGARVIRDTLARHGCNIANLDAILDFGCGAGRVLRHWNQLDGPRICGTDYNPYLVNWSRQAYPFAEIGLNAPSPELDYDDDTFDLIYAISVFTHMPAEQQRPALSELVRVLTPGGLLYVTVHGESYRSNLDAQQLSRFDAGEIVVQYDRYAGSNICGAYHPRRYVEDVLAPELECLEFIPLGARDAKQDIVLLRKPS